MQPKPVLRYPGAKWRLSDWIVSHFPPHEVYCEPFCGSAAVLLAKSPATVETINDLDRRVVTLFRMIRDHPAELTAAVSMTPYSRVEYEGSWDESSDDPIEEARRFLVRVWMAHGGKFGDHVGWRHSMSNRAKVDMPSQWRGLPARLWAVVERLRDVHIECRPALEVIATVNDERCLLYCDPPYLRETLNTHDLYEHDMSDDDHDALLTALLAHPGPVVLSGYPSNLYDCRLRGWQRIDRATTAYQGAARTESLWINPAAADGKRQRSIFDVLTA